MEKHSVVFGVRLHNSPLISLRQEFNAYHSLISQPDFRARFNRGVRPAPIESPWFIWLGMPSGFLTIVLQRAFAGVEAYVVGATYVQLGTISVEQLKAGIDKLMDPFALGGRGAPDVYYNRIPALVSKAHSLQNANAQLWQATRTLYTEVRNPVFHGYEVDSNHVHGVLAVYDHLADMYRWIDQWCDPDSLIPGAGAIVAPKPRGAS